MKRTSVSSFLVLALLFAAGSASADDAACERPPPADASLPAVHLDALGTYSIGSQSAVGGEVHVMASWTEWRGDLDGSLDVGALVSYQAEPSGLAPWVDASTYDGIQHRVRTFVTLGETLRFGGARELSLGLHVYAGVTYVESHGHALHPEYGIDSRMQSSKAVFDAGGFLRFTVRPHPLVGLSIVVGAPFWGLASSYLVDLFTVGAGLTFQLR